ncbi:MAG: hypothetical protein ACOC4L_04685 [Halanaerobium sp.]
MKKIIFNLYKTEEAEIMPVYLKCEKCGKKYYTAANKNKLKQKPICDICGHKLKIIKSDNSKEK